MTWLLLILKNDEVTVTKEYRTACLCCDAVLKAGEYYRKMGEVVTVQMKDEEGRLVFEGEVNRDNQ